MIENTAKARSLGSFLAGSFRLQRRDFITSAGLSAGVFAVAAVIQAAACAALDIGAELQPAIPGLAALVISEAFLVLMSAGRFWMELRIGVQMSIPRRRMLLSGYVLNLAGSVLMLGICAGLDAVWCAFIRRAGHIELMNFLSAVPLWGWALLLFAPVALGAFGGAVVMRFGRRGGAVIYILFLAVCLAPSTVLEKLEAVNPALLEGMLGVAPAVGLVLTFVLGIASVLLLRRVAITE